MRREGATPMKASGNETAVVATLNAIRRARPVQVLTARTEPVRSRARETAAERAPIASSPLRTANMPASDSPQFNAHPAAQMNPASGKNKMKARPGRGSALDETKPEMIAAPARARITARNVAPRKKLRLIKARNGRGLSEPYVLAGRYGDASL